MNWKRVGRILDRAERIIPRHSVSYDTNLWLCRLFGLTIGAALGIPLTRSILIRMDRYPRPRGVGA